MPLKLVLKPQEKVIIAGAVIINGKSATHLVVENKVPILREKDILREAQADSPAKRIYFIIQAMYVDQDHMVAYHDTYWRLVREFMQAAPSALPIINQISEFILGDKLYQALRATRRLIEYEAKLLASTSRPGE